MKRSTRKRKFVLDGGANFVGFEFAANAPFDEVFAVIV